MRRMCESISYIINYKKYIESPCEESAENDDTPSSVDELLDTGDDLE